MSLLIAGSLSWSVCASCPYVNSLYNPLIIRVLSIGLTSVSFLFLACKFMPAVVFVLYPGNSCQDVFIFHVFNLSF